MPPSDVTPWRLGVVGARGRLGSRLVAHAGNLGVPITLVAGRDYWDGGVPDVLVDVSVPEALARTVEFCARNRVPLLSAASGLSERHRTLLVELGRDVAVLRADNLSLGHWLHKRLTTGLAAMLAAVGPDDARWHVLDRHPVTKQHRPSATALALAGALASAGATDVGVDSVRAGVPVCDHTVETVIGEETLAVVHSVYDRSAYVTTALLAARWLYHVTSPGLLTMEDFFGEVLAPSPGLAASSYPGARP